MKKLYIFSKYRLLLGQAYALLMLYNINNLILFRRCKHLKMRWVTLTTEE